MPSRILSLFRQLNSKGLQCPGGASANSIRIEVVATRSLPERREVGPCPPCRDASKFDDRTTGQIPKPTAYHGAARRVRTTPIRGNDDGYD